MNLMAPSLDIILVITVILALLTVLGLLFCLSILRACRSDRTAPVPPSAAGGSREGAVGIDPWRESARRLSIDAPDPESDEPGPPGDRRG